MIERVTAEQLKEILAKPKRSKYRNVKTQLDGIWFDSGAEAERYAELKILLQAGKIQDLRLQVKFNLVPGGRKESVTYVADFVYVENGKQVVEDVKSRSSKRIQAYRIKKKLMKEILGIDILETIRS